MPRRSGRLRRAVTALAAVTAATMIAPIVTSAHAVALPTLPGWTLQDWDTVPSGAADQGVATVLGEDGWEAVLRGGWDVPDALRDQGWVHVGDPGGMGGTLVDAYQGRPSARSILFAFTLADGRRLTYTHRLVAGESYHNSFATVSPDERFLVAGEWGTMRRLLVFAVPRLDPAAPPASRVIRLVGTIRLDRPVADVQGCAFDGATTLMCSTNDPGRRLFSVPRQLLRVTLAAPLDGAGASATVRATVRLAGSIPVQGSCRGPGEVEGIDVHGAVLRVTAVSSCRATAYVYTYTRAA